ncbi:serologically defined colon cancer antigen 8 homolog [Babylonia areolata]|uniref:serologically defined colon cancer antigen 8 homolog n=1 Tax=Babylonia areolata TaxID=304850 RepID=UPI003FD5C67C
MYYFEEYGGAGHSDPQSAVRDKVSQNYDALRETLSAPPPPPSAAISPDIKQRLASSVHPRILTWREGQPQLSGQPSGPPSAPSASAAHTLKLLLDRTQGISSQGAEVSEPVTHTTPTPKPQREAPSAEEVSTLLQQHIAYAQQLESENRYVKEELAVLRLKLSELVDENKRLHTELKTTVVHEILREGGDTVKFMGSMDEGLSETLTTAMNRHDYKRWQVELERLSRLHSTKCDRLEMQLEYSKSEVTRLEQVVEDLKSQLRMQDSVPTHDDAGDFVFSASARTSLQNTIDKISKERDDMCERVAGLTAQNQVLCQREEELYQQVKRSIALVEQAQLEQTEAMVQKEQLGDELGRMRERFEQHVRASQAQTQKEREAARQENQFLIDDLNKKLTDQTSQYAVISEKLEKEVREKAELSAQLLELKGQLRACDREVTIAAENYRAHSTSATLQRSSATQEAGRLRTEYQQLQRERDQERKILQTESAELKRRLHKAEHDLLNAKEECLHLTNNTSALERELHLAKLAREGVERGRSEDLKLISRQASDREEKLRTAMEDAEDKHSQQVHEMDTMLHRQNKLILKLREECKRQAVQIDKITKKYRSQNTKLTNEADSTKQRLERTLARLTMLEEQTDQHGRVHNKMAARLKAMDEHAQNQATQIIEILAINSRLTRDRQLLAKEVEFLRNQLSRINTTEVIRLNSSSKPLVDDILNALTKEERDGSPLIPALKLRELTKTPAELEDDTEAKEDLEEDA